MAIRGVEHAARDGEAMHCSSLGDQRFPKQGPIFTGVGFDSSVITEDHSPRGDNQFGRRRGVHCPLRKLIFDLPEGNGLERAPGMEIRDTICHYRAGGVVESCNASSFCVSKEKLVVFGFLGFWTGDQLIILGDEAKDSSSMPDSSRGLSGFQVIEEGGGSALGCDQGIGSRQERSLKGDVTDLLTELAYACFGVGCDQPARLPRSE